MSIKMREKLSFKLKYFPLLLSLSLQKYENKLARVRLSRPVILQKQPPSTAKSKWFAKAEGKARYFIGVFTPKKRQEEYKVRNAGRSLPQAGLERGQRGSRHRRIPGDPDRAPGGARPAPRPPARTGTQRGPVPRERTPGQRRRPRELSAATVLSYSTSAARCRDTGPSNGRRRDKGTTATPRGVRRLPAFRASGQGGRGRVPPTTARCPAPLGRPPPAP